MTGTTGMTGTTRVTGTRNNQNDRVMSRMTGTTRMTVMNAWIGKVLDGTVLTNWVDLI
jgi:hypothetical protein